MISLDRDETSSPRRRERRSSARFRPAPLCAARTSCWCPWPRPDRRSPSEGRTAVSFAGLKTSSDPHICILGRKHPCAGGGGRWACQLGFAGKDLTIAHLPVHHTPFARQGACRLNLMPMPPAVKGLPLLSGPPRWGAEGEHNKAKPLYQKAWNLLLHLQGPVFLAD